ncbi:MAG: hypothetical protein AAGC55_28405 [Myxococcota bacterium]
MPREPRAELARLQAELARALTEGGGLLAGFDDVAVARARTAIGHKRARMCCSPDEQQPRRGWLARLWPFGRGRA